jgi:hypothetical protein
MTSELLLAISATITAFGVLIGSLTAIYRIAKRIDGAVGLDKEGRTVSERLERVEYQLWENGGSSLADRVSNIEKHVVKVSTEIEFIKDITMGIQTANTDIAPLSKPIIRKSRKKAS